VVGERGVSLSGGQKQRLAIAPGVPARSPHLILDDATSSLDAKTERMIQEDMRRVCLGRTAFVIAHRLTTVRARRTGYCAPKRPDCGTRNAPPS